MGCRNTRIGPGVWGVCGLFVRYLREVRTAATTARVGGGHLLVTSRRERPSGLYTYKTIYTYNKTFGDRTGGHRGRQRREEMAFSEEEQCS